MDLPRVGTAGVPVLVLHGAEDRIADPEASRALAGPGVEVRILEGMGHHLPQGGGASEVIAAVRAWLDGLE